MKKIILFLFVLVTLTGCTIERIDDYNYKQMLDKILSINFNTYNTVGKGYKYYLPYGITRIDSNSNNDTLKRNNNLYYLYVDVVSYYYKSNIKNDEKKEI